MPRLKTVSEKGGTQPVKQITETQDQKRILQTVKAIEGYIILQLYRHGSTANDCKN